jgi:hypothetical protein
MVGVTTAYYLLKHGHEVTQIERQPGWHANAATPTGPGPYWANTRHGLRLSLYSFEAQGDPRGNRRPVRRRHQRGPQGLSEPERASMTSLASSWMSSAAPFITLTAFGPGARPVDEATEVTRIQRGTATLTVPCGDRPCMERRQLLW